MLAHRFAIAPMIIVAVSNRRRSLRTNRRQGRSADGSSNSEGRDEQPSLFDRDAQIGGDLAE
jgi:hypothetical protein